MSMNRVEHRFEKRLEEKLRGLELMEEGVLVEGDLNDGEKKLLDADEWDIVEEEEGGECDLMEDES